MKSLRLFLITGSGCLGLSAACTSDLASIGRDGGNTVARGGESSDVGGVGPITGVGGSIGGRSSTGGGTGGVGTGGVGTGGVGTGGVGTGGVGTGGSSGGAGGTTDTCGVTASGTAPFATRIRFTNPSPQPVWIWQGCRLDFELTSCHDGFSKPLAIIAGCAQSCDVFNPTVGCILCGACLSEAKQILPGNFVDYEWAGQLFSYERTSMPCICYQTEQAAAGLYRVSIPVWTSDPAGASGSQRAEPTYRVTEDFALAQSGLTIEIPLRSRACSFGADQTCNDRLEVSAILGVCQPNGTCLCNSGLVLNPATGRCTIPTSGS